MEKLFTINSRKYDNSIHKSWQCKLLEETKEYWLFQGEFEKEVSHNKLGFIRRKTISYEYYFKEKWFNIFRFHEPEGDFKFFYCNINMPPTFNNGVLNYIDLDIDILVKEDLRFEILDQDEFIENSNKYKYPLSIQLIAKTNLDNLLDKIKRQTFPFNSIFD